MFFEVCARWMFKKPKWSLFLAFLIALFFAFSGKDVRLNNHFAELFAVDNDDNAYRVFYREEFGADDGMLIAVLQPQKVTEHFFAQIDALTQVFEKSTDFVRVLSPTNSSVIWSKGDDVYVDPLFGEFHDQSLALDEKLSLLRRSPNTANHLVSLTSDTFLLIAEMPNDYDRYHKIKGPAEYFQQQIDAAFIDSLDQVKVSYAGIAYTRKGILDLMLTDLLMLVPLTALAIGLFSLWLFRSWFVVWVTLLTMFFALACTVGIMGLNDDDINQLTMTFPVLLMVIVVAGGIHFFHRYFSEIDKGKTVEEAAFITATKVSKAAFLSAFTTMIGFYSLLLADMPILRSFGFYLGTGVLLSFVGMFLIIPSCLLLCAPKTHKHNNEAQFAWVDKSVALFVVNPGRWWLTAIGIGIIFFAMYVASKAEYDYVLSDMLDEGHPQVLSAEILNDEMTGALPIEVSLLGKSDDFKLSQNLQKMDQLSDWLEQHNVGKGNLCLSAVIKSLNSAVTGNNVIPHDDNAIAQLLLLAEGSSDNIIEQLVSDDYSHARIRANSKDIGAKKLVELQQDFNVYASKLFADTGIKVRLSGEIPVAYNGMNRLTQELLESVIGAMFFIVITIFIVFRSMRMALGSIFPNMLPIISGLAIYSLSGVGLNPLPGIAFCIAIGIAVDDTVHLFSRFDEEYAKGVSREQAIKNAVYGVKGALITSSIILTVGFLMFIFSGFTWNRDLGWLGAFLIVTALLSDLIFTPAILSFEKKKSSIND
jgi:hypothetical protein